MWLVLTFNFCFDFTRPNLYDLVACKCTPHSAVGVLLQGGSVLKKLGVNKILQSNFRRKVISHADEDGRLIS